MSAPPRAYGAYLLYEELTFESLFWAALRYQISEHVESLYEREWVLEGEFLCVPLLWALLDVVREEEERLGAAAVAAGALCAEIIESRLIHQCAATSTASFERCSKQPPPPPPPPPHHTTPRAASLPPHALLGTFGNVVLAHPVLCLQDPASEDETMDEKEVRRRHETERRRKIDE
ncbi:hypothetical protein IQ06DRAFT_303139 [Phaeosphaeriaceae sp. SRC1lsM3a]|nr:hypothetical protein IQ06DRAFT_303139 [Stagonospora sp. SRC1lsM3a]